jgi:hypothetical protein
VGDGEFSGWRLNVPTKFPDNKTQVLEVISVSAEYIMILSDLWCGIYTNILLIHH